MAEKFSLVAQIQLQAPTNTRQVVDRIRRELSGVSVQLEAKGAAKTANEVGKVNKQLKNASKSATSFANNIKIATQRAAGLAIATRAVSALTSRFKSAVDEAISFQRELVKVSQVTGKTLNQLKGLTKEITNLSTTLGVSSSSLISVSRQLSQAGFEAADLQIALSALAKTALAPTFDDITRTAEGAIAIFNQFGKGAAALEAQLGAINAVAGQFAVESGDLIGVVQRVGGVFKSAGGELNELIALFTSVRATTRESSESIATGLRTIFTRIQRPRTIAFLKNLGVSLTDAEGRFVGPIKAVEALNKAFANLPQGDLRFVQIAEELGGFRQIGKVIPLIQQFAVAQEALKVAEEGQSSLAKDAATAQQSLAVQIEKVRQEYLALIREFTDSSSFKLVVGLALNFASALAKVLSALNDILPLLAGLGIASFASRRGGLGGLLGGLRRNQGGPIGFARGGVVPGTGNRDTVPAMLTPGEFVIKKSSVGKIGAGTLAQMNENRFARGGSVTVKALNNKEFGALSVLGPDGNIAPQGVTITGKAAVDLRPKVDSLLSGIKGKDVKGQQTKPIDFNYNKGSLNSQNKNIKVGSGKFQSYLKGRGAAFNTGGPGKPSVSRENRIAAENAFKKDQGKVVTKEANQRAADFRAQAGTDYAIKLAGPFGVRTIGGPSTEVQKDFAKLFDEVSREILGDGVKKIAKSKLVKSLNVDPIKADESKLFNFSKFFEGASESVEGFLLEGVIGGLTNAKVSGGGTNFDFPFLTKASKERLKRLFSNDDNFISSLGAADAKRSKSGAETGDSKLVNKIAKDSRLQLSLLNSGGGISGQDTVPALLTPGEFVINKKAAQSIGSANLNTMNKKGVVGFNKGGMVGVQRFTEGGQITGLNTEALVPLTDTGKELRSREIARVEKEKAAASQKATNRILALSLAAGSLATASSFARDNLGEYGDAVGDTLDATLALTTTFVAAKSILDTLDDGPLKSLGTAATGAVVAFQAVTAITGVFAKSFERSAQSAAKLGSTQEAVAAQQQADSITNFGTTAGSVAGGAAAGAALGSVIPVLGTVAGGLVGALAGGVAGKFLFDEQDKTGEVAAQSIGANLASLDTEFDRFSKGTRSSAVIIRETQAQLARAKAESQKFIKDEATAAKVRADIDKQELRLATEVIGPTAKSMDELKKQTENMSKANQEAAEAAFKVAAAQRELIKVNLDSARIQGATVRAGTAVQNVIDRFKTGSSALEADFRTLEAGTTTFGTSDEGKAALARIQTDINSRLDSLGITGEARAIIDRSAASSGAAVEFSSLLSDRIANAEFTRGQDKKAQIEGIITEITGELGDARLTNVVEGSLESVIKNATVNGQIDESKVVEGLAKAANAAGKPLRIFGEALIKHEKLINQLTAQRRAQEQKLIAAQSKAIDLQLEGAKVIEQAGGKRLSLQDKTRARGAQADLLLRDAGVGGLGGTGAGNVRAAGRRIANRNAELNQRVIGGGRLSVDDDRRKELQKANQGLIKFTRDRIKLIQQEMEIVKKKNALEKSAIEALLSGDAEQFFEAQGAAAAASAIRSGNTALLRSLDASDISKGLASLEGELSSADLFAAARTAGLSERQARIFSGTTNEEQNLNRQLMEQGRNLSTLGGVSAELEASNLQTAIQTINEANKAFQETLVREMNAANQVSRETAENVSKTNLEVASATTDNTTAIGELTDTLRNKKDKVEVTINDNGGGGSRVPNDDLEQRITTILSKLINRVEHVGANGSHRLGSKLT